MNAKQFKSMLGTSPPYLFLISIVFLSCTPTEILQKNSLSDQYWRIQTLRMEANSDVRATGALLELGLIYLGTGYFEEANDAFTLAISKDRSNPKLWFYSGLSQELLGNRSEALSRFKRAPGRSQQSVYSQAIRGRIAWLEEFALLQKVGDLHESESPSTLRSGLENLHVLRPVQCITSLDQYANLGLGLSALIAHDLDQIQGIDFFDIDLTRLAFNRAPNINQSNIDEQAKWSASLFDARKFISSTCDISANEEIDIGFTIFDLETGNSISIDFSGDLQNIAELETNMIDQLLTDLRIYVPNRERRMPVAGMPLDALVDLSNAIYQEDQGNFPESINLFERAIRRAPNFTTGRIKLERAETRQLSAGISNEDILQLLQRLEATSSIDLLMTNRSVNAQNYLNSGFFPDQGARKLPPGAVGELPLPPTPTGN